MNHFIRTIFSIFLSLFTISLFAADYYWIGGTGNWSDLNNWATTSGGNITHQQVPTSEDDVYFDANSFDGNDQIVEINGNLAFCRNMDFREATGGPIFRTAANNTLNIFGNVFFNADMTIGINGSVQLSGDNQDNILDFQGALVGTNFFIEGNGSWTFANDVDVLGTFFLNRGAMHLGDATLTTGFFHSHSSAPRELYWDNGTIIVENGSEDFGDLGNPGNVYSIELYSENWTSYSSNGTLILPHPASKIFIQSRELWPIDPGGTILFDDIIVQADFGHFDFINWHDQSDIIIRDLRLNHNSNILTEASVRDIYLAPGFRYLLHGDSDFTVNNLYADGTCEAPITLQSASVGQTTRVSFTEEVNISYVELSDIHVANGVGILTNGTDRGNNDGWIIMGRQSSDYFWIGDGGNWASPMHWSLSSGGPPAGCIPSSADNVIFDLNSFSVDNQSVVINIPDASCRSMEWRGVSNSPTLAGDGANNLSISGSLYFDQNMTNDFQGRVSFVGGEQGLEVLSNGRVFNAEVFFENPNGQWTVLDDIDIGSALRVVNGHVIFDDVDIDVYDFDTQTDTERVIDFNSSVLNLIQRGPVLARGSFEMANLTLNSDQLIINTYGNETSFRFYGEKPIVFKEFNSFANFSHLESYLFGDDTSISFEKVYYKYSGGFIGELIMDTLLLTGGNFYDLNDSRTHLFVNEMILDLPCQGIADIYTRDVFYIGTKAQITFQVTQSISGFSFRDISAHSDFGDVEVLRGVDAGRNEGFRFVDYEARDLYWVGGSGQWTDSQNWSLTSGGQGGECAPTKLDNVFFDENSFDSNQDIVRSDSIRNITCRNFVFTAPENDITFQGVYFKVQGSLLLDNTVNWLIPNLIIDGENEIQSIRTSGSIMQNFYVEGRAPVSLEDDLTLANFRGVEFQH